MGTSNSGPPFVGPVRMMKMPSKPSFFFLLEWSSNQWLQIPEIQIGKFHLSEKLAFVNSNFHPCSISRGLVFLKNLIQSFEVSD